MVRRVSDEELKALFPVGAMLLPQDGSPSSAVRVGQDWVDEDIDDKYFLVWFSPYHELALKRTLEPFEEGYRATSAGNKKYFLRPLAEGQEVPF